MELRPLAAALEICIKASGAGQRIARRLDGDAVDAFEPPRHSLRRRGRYGLVGQPRPRPFALLARDQLAEGVERQ